MTQLSFRTRAALLVERAAAGASRALGRGSGEMIGGKLALRVAPHVLADIAAGRPAACVSGTNGKTTTTRLLSRALGTLGPVKTNGGGANMAPGVVAALARPPFDSPAALEVDEIWLPKVAREVQPRAVLLLNISRDQLDRSNETRRIAGLWRDLGAQLPSCTAVANCDDPLVAWAAYGYRDQLWVSAGQNWTADAMVCPQCARLLHRGAGRPDGTSGSGGAGPADPADWWCPCGLSRPTPSVAVTGPDELVWQGRRIRPELDLPGRVNVANAAMAAATAGLFGVGVDAALAAMTGVGDVQGRYRQVPLGDRHTGRLLLAKNPAGWVEMMELLQLSPARPVVVDFNSRTADGRDPSWIWDVPFERLRGREVLVTGERKEDMSVRLAYAEVPHRVYPSAEAAAAAAAVPEVDVVANYTAFRDLLVRTTRTAR